MFLGHFAVGFGAKALAPETSLGSLFLAALLPDLLWPTLLLLGVERVWIGPESTEVMPLNFEYFPFSHGLALVVVWGVLVAVVYLVLRQYARGAIVMGLAVISHWFLDLVVHHPDLPLYPGSTRYGLGLWSSKSGTLVVEMTLFLVGIGIYFNKTVPRDDKGDWRLGCLIVALMGIYFFNLFGPPPPGVSAIIWAGQAQWVLILWAYWADNYRMAVHSIEEEDDESSNSDTK